MPVHFERFKADHQSIAEFLVSGQLRDAVHRGAQDVAELANRTAGITDVRGSYEVQPGPNVVVTRNGNPRLSEHVVSGHPAAAADEFGSGSGSWRGGEHKRPQGGGSPPFRTLGKAGAHVGDGLGTGDD